MGNNPPGQYKRFKEGYIRSTPSTNNKLNSSAKNRRPAPKPDGYSPTNSTSLSSFNNTSIKQKLTIENNTKSYEGMRSSYQSVEPFLEQEENKEIMASNKSPRPPSKPKKKKTSIFDKVVTENDQNGNEDYTGSMLKRRMAKPPSKGKGIMKRYESVMISSKDAENPLGEVSSIARIQGVGNEGIFGYHCYKCKTLLHDAVSGTEEPLSCFFKCINCDRISSSILACRIVPFEENQEGGKIEWSWICYARKKCLSWTKMLSTAEEQAFLAEIEDLRSKDVNALTSILTDEFHVLDVESLDTFFPLERKEELVQYVLLYRHNDLFRANDGYLREEMRNGEILWSRVGSYRLDPNEFVVGNVKCDANEIAEIVRKPFEDRLVWFRNKLSQLVYEDEYDGPLRITVHRDRLLEEASNWINALHGEQCFRTTRYEFKGEPAMDSGGVAKEWYRLVCDSVFKPQFGLFERTDIDDVSYDFNPNSGLFQPERHLHYFRFAGRILAKAIFEGCFVQAHLTKAIYKHILQRPLSLHDLRFFDSKVYDGLMYLVNNPDQVEDMGLTFTVMAESMGHNQEIQLKGNGSEIAVVRDNLAEYIKLCVKYYLYERCKLQLNTFLKGFHEIIPPTFLLVFDHSEFEQLMCGNSEIDVDDWRNNVTYRGVFKEMSTPYKEHKVVQWFWKTVSSFDEFQKSKLLQFLTGSSRVPVGGFAAFDDGHSMLISIESIGTDQSVFPRAHTCFNRLELPLYDSEEELASRLTEVINVTNGFNLE